MHAFKLKRSIAAMLCAAMLGSAAAPAALAETASTPDEPKKERSAEVESPKASVSVKEDSVTVTITGGDATRKMVILLGDDLFFEGVTVGDTRTFTSLAAGSYDLEVDYVDPVPGITPVRTTVTVPGKSETTPPTAGETTPPTAGETTPPTAGETTPPISGETTPPTSGETTPPAGGETTPPTSGETTPPTSGETTPPTAGETTPPTSGETTPPTAGETTPPTAGETTPPAAGETTPPAQEQPVVMAMTRSSKAGEKTGAIEGTVSFGGDTDMVAKLYDGTGAQIAEQTIPAGGDGSFAFTNLGADTYTVAFHYWGNSSPVLSLKYTVNVAAAEQLSATATVSTARIDVQVSKASALPVTVTLTLGGKEVAVKRIEGGVGAVSFDKLASGDYTVSVDYETAQSGCDPVVFTSLSVLAEVADIAISKVTAGENQLTVTGTAQPGADVTLTTEPATNSTIVRADAKGQFTATITCAAGTYTAVHAQYGADSATKVSKTGSFAVTAPATKPTLATDPITTSSLTVIARTAAGTVVNLKTGDYGQTVTAGSDGMLRFTLPHTYAAGTVVTFTVYYGKDNAQSFTQTVKVTHPVSYSLLKRGTVSDEVYALTARLAELGYPISATRSYTDSVAAAVRLFQSANGLAVDGLAGQLTQTALYSLSAVRYGGEGEYPTFVRGDRGYALIYTLQQRLKDLGYYTIRVDGIFGSGTQRAVRDFQYVNGLTPTGVADSTTQKLLYSSAAKPVSGTVSGSYTTLSRSPYYNAAVVTLQRRLKALGYLTSSVDGYFGTKTYRAVCNFQSRNGLSVTGIADPTTQQVLYSAGAKAASGSSSSSTTGYRLLYWGCKGDAVKRLQSALLAAGYSQVKVADGIYGQWTYDGVRAFQKDHGLAVDGIAGKNTQNALYGTSY